MDAETRYLLRLAGAFLMFALAMAVLAGLVA